MAPNILHKTLLKVNWSDCLTEELVGQASVPYNNIGKHLDFSITLRLRQGRGYG